MSGPETKATARRPWRWVAAAALAALLGSAATLAVWNERLAERERTVLRLGGKVGAYAHPRWLPIPLIEFCMRNHYPLPAALRTPLTVTWHAERPTPEQATEFAAALDRAEIRYLSIRGEIDDVAPFVRVGGWKTFFVEGRGIGDDDAAALATVDTLEVLGLSGTAVTDAGVAALVRLPKLRTLELDGAAVTNDVIPHLEAMPALEEVSLSATAVSESQLEALANRKPKFTFTND